MKRNSWLALSALSMMFLGACSGDTTEDKSSPTDTAPTDTETDGVHAHSDVAGLNPEFVAFELETAILADGTLSNWMISGYDLPPMVYMKFVELDYFYSASTAEADSHACTVFGTWLATPLANPDSLDGDFSLATPPNDAFIAAYEHPLAVEYSTCQDVIDENIWGPDGYDLHSAFNGAHFGIGFGPMTEEWIDDLGFFDQESKDFLLANSFLQYVAINDAAGDFVAKPWSYIINWQWDSTTKEPTVDGDGYLVPVDVSDGTIHEALLLAGAIWYEGFYDMDFANLHDGAR
ncbi:MAG: hypothetical protein H6734_27795 [Alphaproteobacteria bacterium]|nr:hypothetical protein [Alphaproteobacteria bacterium]